MRKIAFTSNDDSVKKVMLYERQEGTYIFGYDSLTDCISIFDNLYDSIDDAEDFCKDEYLIDIYDWIVIDDPLNGCQHDFIMPTRIKDKENGKVEFGHFQTLIYDTWVDIEFEKTKSLSGMTVHERLFVSGLSDEFEKSKIIDKKKAERILLSLNVDSPSIKLILK